MTEIGADSGLVKDLPLLVVAAALIDRRGDVLLQRRPEGKAMAGLWEFPGGKVERGETPEAALVRELYEELGIVVAPAALSPLTFATADLGARSLILLLYGIRSWEGTPRPLEAPELRWVAPAAMRALAMPPADLPLVEYLAGDLQLRG